MLLIQSQILAKLFLLVIVINLVVKALSQNSFKENLLLTACIENILKPIENGLPIVP